MDTVFNDIIFLDLKQAVEYYKPFGFRWNENHELVNDIYKVDLYKIGTSMLRAVVTLRVSS